MQCTLVSKVIFMWTSSDKCKSLFCVLPVPLQDFRLIFDLKHLRFVLFFVASDCSLNNEIQALSNSLVWSVRVSETVLRIYSLESSKLINSNVMLACDAGYVMFAV